MIYNKAIQGEQIQLWLKNAKTKFVA